MLDIYERSNVKMNQLLQKTVLATGGRNFLQPSLCVREAREPHAPVPRIRSRRAAGFFMCTRRQAHGRKEKKSSCKRCPTCTTLPSASRGTTPAALSSHAVCNTQSTDGCTPVHVHNRRGLVYKICKQHTALPSASRGWKSSSTGWPASKHPVSQPRSVTTLCTAAGGPTCD